MAIKVGGTEIVSNSRELKNIATVDAGTVSVFNTALNTDPTRGSLTKTFTNGETASITLSSAISPAPVVSATKEVAQAGISSKGAWDVNATASNYELHNTAYATTLTPSTALDLTSATYDNNSRSTGGSYGPRFSSDGLKLFVNDQGANNIRQYNLSTAWLLPSSATHTTFSTASQVTDESGFCFSDNGLHFYLCDRASATAAVLHQYSITSGYPYDLSGYGSFTRTINLTTLGEAAPSTRSVSTVLIEQSGTKMYVFSSSSSEALIRQYTLSTAYDPSSATYDNKFFDIRADYGSGRYLGNSSLSSDGKQLLLANGVDDIVMHYTLGTAWDISTASRIGTYDPAEDANVSGIHLKPDNSKFFMLGGSNQTFYRYTLGSSNALALGTGSFASTDVGKRIQGNGGDVTLTSTAGAYSTTGGSAFTDSSTIASGSWSMRGLKSAGATDGITIPSFLASSYGVAGSSSTADATYVPSGPSGHKGFTWKSDGTKFYVVGDNNREVYEFPVTTPYDISTASSSTAVTTVVSAQTSQSNGVIFNNSGTQFAIADNQNNRVVVFTMSTEWDLTTASQTWNSAGGYGTPTAMLLASSGSVLWVANEGNSTFYKHPLSTANDFTTMTYDSSTQVDLGPYGPAGIWGAAFNGDGTKVFIVDDSADKIWSFDLSTAYDFTTFQSPTTVKTLSAVAWRSLNFSADGTKMHIMRESGTTIEQYNVGSSLVPTSQYHIGITNSGGQIDSEFWTDINSMTADQSLGNGTVHYAVSTDDRTTWSVAKGSDGVRPIVRDNSGTWQYNSDNVSTSTLDITGATYSGDANTFSTSSQDTQSYTVSVKPDGTKIYVASYNSDNVYQYDLSTAFDLSTASYNNINFSFNSQMSEPRGIYFKPDGTEMYLNNTTGVIYQYTMSTAWDLSTASYSGYSFDTPITGNTYGIHFKSDGTKLYISDQGGTDQLIYEHDLSVAWRVSTASYNNKYLNARTEMSGVLTSFAINPTGTKVHAYDYGTRYLYEYDLSTAWDMSTASYNSVNVDLDPQPSSAGYGQPSTIHLDYTSGYLYAMRSERLFEWSGLTTSSLPYSTTATWANATTNDEFYALQQALSLANNRMDKTQLDAVADGSHFTLGDTLDLAIALRQDTASASTPKSDGVSINYDAAALNQGAVLGTDYDYDFPDSTTVRVTSNSAQNLKVRVV